MVKTAIILLLVGGLDNKIKAMLAVNDKEDCDIIVANLRENFGADSNL